MQKTLKIGLLIGLIIIVVAWLSQGFGFSLKIPQMTKGEATLSWEIADDAKDYKVYWGESPRNADCPSGGYANNEDAGKTGEYKISGLEAGKTYYFSISAVGEGGKESCFSPETKKEIPSGWKLAWENIF